MANTCRLNRLDRRKTVDVIKDGRVLQQAKKQLCSAQKKCGVGENNGTHQ